MTPEQIIEDIIWAFSKTKSIPNVKKMYKPLLMAWAMKSNDDLDVVGLKTKNQEYKLDSIESYVFNNLKKTRLKLGLTLREVKDITGISQSMLCHIEKGNRLNLSMATIKTLRIFIANAKKPRKENLEKVIIRTKRK